MILFRLVIAAVAAAFAGLIVWASLARPIGESFAAMVADPWGVVTLVDLYLGFAVFGVVVVLTERRLPVALAVVVATALLGNLVTLGWLVLRLPRLVARLRPGNDRAAGLQSR